MKIIINIVIFLAFIGIVSATHMSSRLRHKLRVKHYLSINLLYIKEINDMLICKFLKNIWTNMLFIYIKKLKQLIHLNKKLQMMK